MAVLKDIAEALPVDEIRRRAVPPFLQGLQELQETVQETVMETVQEVVKTAEGGEKIEMPFLHNLTPDIITEWSLQDFDPSQPNDKPNLNLAVMGLILVTNIESTVGKHAWSLIEYSLERVGFTIWTRRAESSPMTGWI